MRTKNCIFIVDDDPSVRKSLERLLRSHGYRVQSWPSVEEFQKRKTHRGPACLVLDLRMPGQTGLQLQEYLLYTQSSLPIIFFTGYGDVTASVRAMKAGAVDFLTKPLKAGELLEAIERALMRSQEALRQDTQRRRVDDKMKRLSPREHAVLDRVILGRLNKQIARELKISEKTVKVHRARVMAKMQAHSLAELVRMTHFN